MGGFNLGLNYSIEVNKVYSLTPRKCQKKNKNAGIYHSSRIKDRHLKMGLLILSQEIS